LKVKILFVLIGFWVIYDVSLVYVLVQRNRADKSLFFSKSAAQRKDSVWFSTCFDSLVLTQRQKIKTSLGTKSLISDGKWVFALNLEAMNIDIFEILSYKKIATLYFQPTQAQGFDYKQKKKINSFAEKPVEAALTHQGRFLWVSLHNAQGVVVWDRLNESFADDLPYKSAIFETDSGQSQLRLAFFKTGETPKFIVANDSLLFVSNWHSNTVSAFSIKGEKIENWRKIKDIAVGRVPRGMAIWSDTLWVANMGQSTLSLVSLNQLEVVAKREIGPTPRHIIAQDGLYITLSAPEQIVWMPKSAGLKITQTCDDPRSLTLVNGVVFTACYGSSEIEAFDSQLNSLGRWKTAELPIGLESFFRNGKLEVWVGHYKTGFISVLTFTNPQSDRRSECDNDWAERDGSLP
jgi:hypothetical protein